MLGQLAFLLCRSCGSQISHPPASASDFSLSSAQPASALLTHSLSTTDSEVKLLSKTSDPAAADKGAKAASAAAEAASDSTPPLSKSQQRKARLAQRQEEMRLKGLQAHQPAESHAAKTQQDM